MKKIIAAAILGIAALGAQSVSLAADSGKMEYKAAVKQADIDYKVAKDKCGAVSGNDKDVCMKEAKAAHVTAISNAKADRKVHAARKDATEDQNEAYYKAAKEKCDVMSGDAKTDCINKARTEYKQ